MVIMSGCEKELQREESGLKLNTFVFFSLAALPAGLLSVCRILKLDFCYSLVGLFKQ